MRVIALPHRGRRAVQFWFAVGSGTASWYSDRLARRLGLRVLALGSGVAVIGIVFFGSLPGGAAGTAGRQAYNSAFQHALLYEIGVFVLAFLLVFLLPRERNPG